MRQVRFLVPLLLLTVAWHAQAQLSGAIFTTLEDGTRVNHNIYDAMEDVYLDGGPGPNAPAGAAGLPAGDYYFQVTDPSGKVLLSEDAVECRRVTVSEDGVIVAVTPASALVKVKGDYILEDCTHITGVDIDHAELGAITVRLMPYSKTPNKGGVYKVWMTPVDKFVGDPALVDNPDYFHGFVPRWSKTDNYKIRRTRGPNPPPVEEPEGNLMVLKCHDLNANGVQDAGEPDIGGWQIDITDPLGVVNTHYTPVDIVVTGGTWGVAEAQPDGWMQTALYLNDVAQAVSPSISVAIPEAVPPLTVVEFGNVQLASVAACKFYDANGNGVLDDGEAPVAGIRFNLTGTDVTGAALADADPAPGLQGVTGEDGCVVFDDLLPPWPGTTYTLSEVVPPGWIASTTTSRDVALAGGDEKVELFGNYCAGTADFGTKGYWHNKNGLAETSQEDLDYLNSLLPWQSPSDYFGAGDEPFDGLFENGDPVAAANGEWGELLAPEGSAWAEQSHFLVDPNAGGDPREQLAQQLDAFIMNARNRLGGVGASIWLDGDWVSAEEIIGAAIDIWAGGTEAEQTQIASLLDWFNNNDAVPYIHLEPCEVVYP